MTITVTFDLGQTLADLDTAMLARRAGERGVAADASALEAAVPAAWARYDAAIREGAGGPCFLMRTLLKLHVDANAVDGSPTCLGRSRSRTSGAVRSPACSSSSASSTPPRSPSA